MSWAPDTACFPRRPPPKAKLNRTGRILYIRDPPERSSTYPAGRQAALPWPSRRSSKLLDRADSTNWRHSAFMLKRSRVPAIASTSIAQLEDSRIRIQSLLIEARDGGGGQGKIPSGIRRSPVEAGPCVWAVPKSIYGTQKASKVRCVSLNHDGRRRVRRPDLDIPGVSGAL